MLGEILEDQDHSQFREDRVFLSSQQSGGEETDTNDTRRAKLSIRSRPPRLLESAVLCYFSMLLLRLPVLSSDLRSWIISDNFPYMHATKYLPLEMKQRLPDRLRYSLEPPADPHKLEHLHTTAMALAASYQTSFGMIIPGLNTPLILHKMIKTLCLPLCIYTGTERLAALLNLKFDFSRAMGKKIYISQHPEIALICAVIITTKLFFPMDEHRRYSTSTSEPAGLSINWPHWFQQFSASQKSSEPRSAEQQNASNAAHLATTEHDVFNMSTKQMDDYLDWFARTGWLDEEDAEVGKEKDYRHALYKMFPLDIPEQEESSSNTRERANLESIRAVHGTLRPNLVVEADEDEKVTGKSKVLRPGSKYRRYRSKEEMPETARIFYKAAGELVNLELDDIVLAVLQLEFRLGEWVDKQRK
jgi:RNA polymerase I-specific transcription initiation factor RRN7